MLTNIKLKLAGLLTNLGVHLLPKKYRTQYTINNLMLTRMIKGVTLDSDNINQGK